MLMIKSLKIDKIRVTKNQAHCEDEIINKLCPVEELEFW